MPAGIGTAWLAPACFPLSFHPMFFARSRHAHPDFRRGIHDAWSQVPGIAAWGLMTGVAMVQSGLSVMESSLMTLLVYAGSSQLAGIPLLAAGAPIWVILATSFCVNLRFVVFSLHLRPYLMHLPRWQRMVSGYLTADLTYVAFTQAFPKPAQDAAGQRAQDAYLAGHHGLLWAGWMLASLIGVVAADQVPTRWGLGFAGILTLLGIMCSLASTRLRTIAAAVAGAAAVAAFALPFKLNIVVAIAAAVLLCLGLEQRRPTAAGRVV